MDKEIIKRLAQNTATSEEQNAFASWLKSASQKEVEQSAKAFEDYSANTETTPQAPPELLLRILSQIETKRFKQVSFQPSIQWIKYAASFIFLLAASWLLVNKYLQKDKTEWVSVSVPFGETRVVLLSDSSKVILNAGSTLSYPNVFTSAQRQIELKGEGFFEVRRDEHKPFIVKSGALDVSVLGTSFNIKNYEHEPIEVTVATGLVKVKSITNDSVMLKPNQHVLFERATGLSQVGSMDATQVASWKNGTLVFTNKNLMAIAKQLERLYNKKVILANQKLVACRPVGEHNNQSLESVLSSLQFVLDIEYKITKDSVIINGKGCN